MRMTGRAANPHGNIAGNGKVSFIFVFEISTVNGFFTAPCKKKYIYTILVQLCSQNARTLRTNLEMENCLNACFGRIRMGMFLE